MIPCQFCHYRECQLLCDGRLEDGSRCDKRICRECARLVTSHKESRHLCQECAAAGRTWISPAKRNRTGDELRQAFLAKANEIAFEFHRAKSVFETPIDPAAIGAWLAAMEKLRQEFEQWCVYSAAWMGKQKSRNSRAGTWQTDPQDRNGIPQQQAKKDSSSSG
jgi:hypothetical protein